MFVDKTNLTVGPTSEVLLDKFVYDPAGANGKVVMQMTRGAFRFVTGTQDHRAYAVNTPYGSLGVRGTVVEVVVQEKTKGKPRPDECTTRVRLVEGAGASFTTSSGKTARLTEPNQVVCISPSGAVSYSSSSTSILGFQVAQQAPPPAAGAPPGAARDRAADGSTGSSLRQSKHTCWLSVDRCGAAQASKNAGQQ